MTPQQASTYFLQLLKDKKIPFEKVQEGKEMGYLGSREDQYLLLEEVEFTSEELDPLRDGEVLVDPLPAGLGLHLASRKILDALCEEQKNSDLYGNIKNGCVWRPSQRFWDYTAFIVK